jgi:hypothetical protein
MKLLLITLDVQEFLGFYRELSRPQQGTAA